MSQPPEAVGLIPWDKADPGVKAIAVNGEPLLEPGTADLESYRLKRVSPSGPDTQKLRLIVVAGHVVMDRGMSYMVFDQERGIDFPLDDGYAAVAARVPEPNQASEFGIIHQFNAEHRGMLAW
ncbi:MAG: hypothetical protein JOZ19_04190 [Rubrobacter sp.]|nr:hypothetical protein [Rubrobacter sp.]